MMMMSLGATLVSLLVAFEHRSCTLGGTGGVVCILLSR